MPNMSNSLLRGGQAHKTKLLDQVRAVSRLKHYSVRTVTTTLGCLMEPGDYTLVVRATDGEGDV